MECELLSSCQSVTRHTLPDDGQGNGNVNHSIQTYGTHHSNSPEVELDV